MVQMLNIAAPGTITSPLPGAPRLIDVVRHPHLDITAQSLVGSYADDEEVTEIIAEGYGPIGWRTLNNKLDTIPSFPKLKYGATPTGMASLVFDGASQICNSSLTYNAQLTPPLPQCTRAVVFKVSSWGSVPISNRIFSGYSGHLGNLRISETVPGSVIFSNGSNVTRAMPEGTDTDVWIIVIASFNQSGDDLIKVSTNASESVSTGTNDVAGIIMGAQLSSGVNTGFSGEIATVRQYATVMNAAQQNSLFLKLESEFITG